MSQTPEQHKSFPHEEHNLMGSTQVVEWAQGSHVYMTGEAEPYTDFVMGYSAANFGHMNADITPALSSADADNVVFFDSRAKQELTKSLGTLMGLEGPRQFYYPVGGAMAVEAAARACMLATPDGALVSFTGAFHGYSGVSRSLTDPAFVQKDVFTAQAPILRSPRPVDVGSTDKALAQLDDTLAQKRVAGVFVEPVQGAAGFHDLGKEFLSGIRQVCTDRKVPMVVDEIQSAFFRHGEAAVSVARGVDPDVMLLGKSLGGGLVPLSAVIAKESFMARVPREKAAFDSTFSGWPLGVAVGQRVVTYALQHNFTEMAKEKGQRIDTVLDQTVEHPEDRSAFRRVGMGLAFDARSPQEALAVYTAALERRVIIQTTGMHGDKCKMSPAITISDTELSQGIAHVAAAVAQVRQR